MPDKIGEYRVLKTLSAGASVLCLNRGGRRVVLKRLESDCLLRGQLHPSIKERLARVRELAQKNVATLHTVDRLDGTAWLVWDFVDGETFQDRVISAKLGMEELVRLFRDLVLSAEALHAHGIIHGSLHARNVIVDSQGAIHLTHVSPLLYNDPAADAAGVLGMMRDAVAQRGQQAPVLNEATAMVDGMTPSLSQLASILARVADRPRALATATVESGEKMERFAKRRAWVAAAAAAVLGVIVSGATYVIAARRPAHPASAEPVRLDEPGLRR